MAIDIDWIARFRAAPSQECPAREDLEAFIESPETVRPAAFSHIVSGCSECRTLLQRLALHPSDSDLRSYVRNPEAVPEDTVLHFVECRECQARVREVLRG